LIASTVSKGELEALIKAYLIKTLDLAQRSGKRCGAAKSGHTSAIIPAMLRMKEAAEWAAMEAAETVEGAGTHDACGHLRGSSVVSRTAMSLDPDFVDEAGETKATDERPAADDGDRGPEPGAGFGAPSSQVAPPTDPPTNPLPRQRRRAEERAEAKVASSEETRAAKATATAEADLRRAVRAAVKARPGVTELSIENMGQSLKE
jgi:hypothetical protein